MMSIDGQSPFRMATKLFSSPQTTTTTPESLQRSAFPASKSISTTPSALQQHVLFWDPDRDGIIHPSDIYSGFRRLGFSIPYSLLALLIPVFFAYRTTPPHFTFGTWFSGSLPDWRLRIYLSRGERCVHRSDSGCFDAAGGWREDVWERMWSDAVQEREDRESIGARQAWKVWWRNGDGRHPMGWVFAAMEWSTTWVLVARDGRVTKNDLKACYDGSYFERRARERSGGGTMGTVGLRTLGKGLWAVLEERERRMVWVVLGMLVGGIGWLLRTS